MTSVLLWNASPSTRTAQAVRILYYVSLGWLALWLAAAILFGLAIAFTNTGESFGYRLSLSIGITVLCLFIGLTPALVLRLIYQAVPQRPR